MIELRRLGYLVVLAKRLSYSRAAIDLGLSQSALTRAIQSLEKEIGMRLFDRGQSGVRLTEQGRWVVAKAEVLLTNATDFANQLAFAAKGEEGRIRIGMTATVAHLLLPDALPARITDTPRFSHEVLVRDVEPLYLMLAQGQIEFLICSEPSSIWSIPDVMPVKISSLGKLPIGLVVRDGHPLLDDAEPGGRVPILVASAENRSGHSVAFLLEWIGSSVQIIEDRLLRFDIADMTLQVSGGKFYEVDAFLTYRIEDPRLFRERALGELSVAEDRIATRFDAALRQVYGRREFNAALSEERTGMMEEARDLARRNIEGHRQTMQKIYIGACVVAGGFTLLPDRFLGHSLWSALGVI